jgi:hypothetical protein
MRILPWIPERLPSQKLAEIMSRELRVLEESTGLVLAGIWTAGVWQFAGVELVKDKLLVLLATDVREPHLDIKFSMIDRFQTHEDWNSHARWRMQFSTINLLYLTANGRCSKRAEQLLTRRIRYNNESSVAEGAKRAAEAIQICGARFLEGDYTEFDRDPLNRV